MKKLVMLSFAACLIMAGCTENQRARQFGGTSVEVLPAGQKLVVATWKQNNLWMLTRPARPAEQVETYEFIESSPIGVWQGKVIIREQK